MVNVYIYGLGAGRKILDKCLIKNEIKILAYIDNYKVGKDIDLDAIPIIKEEDLPICDSKIIISLMKYSNIKESLINRGFTEKNIICFYDFKDASNEENWDIIDSFKWRTELMWKNNNDIIIPTFNNVEYEIYADTLIKNKDIPTIIPIKETIKILIEEKKSLARFGDGEFEIIAGKERPKFQSVCDELGDRLRKVLNSNVDNLLVAIADNYGRLDKYTSNAASIIRQYMGSGAREEHMKVLDTNRMYHNAYISRPYLIYRDKIGARERFENIKKIWSNQNILIVEGEHTRFGVGNDLLSNAKSVQRIVTLDRDCFNVYDKLLNKVKYYAKNKLVMIVLGPVATIMAYDLAIENYWAIDIGQLDVEYEWFLRGVEDRCDIPYKTVSEVEQRGGITNDFISEHMKTYKKEIKEIIKE